MASRSRAGIASRSRASMASRSLFRVCVFRGGVLFDILDMRFHKPRDSNFSAERDLFAADFAIFFAFRRNIFKLGFKIARSFAGSIVAENVKRRLASVEAMRAKLGFRLFIRHALFILKDFAAGCALHIFVCAFVDLHFFTPFLNLP
jgi:hypothetical protein